jgi:hypothetical protein
MKEQDHIREQVAAFLRGELPAETQRALLEDEAFVAALTREEELREALGPSGFNGFRETVSTVVREKAAGPDEKAKVWKRHKALAAVIFAIAILALLILGWWWTRRPSAEKVFAQYFVSPYVPVTARGTAPAGELGLRVDSLYLAGDYDMAARILRLSSGPENSATRLLLAELLLRTGRPDATLDILDDMSAGPGFEKEWLRAWAYFMVGRHTDARIGFEAILRSESPFRDEARQMLDASGLSGTQ